LIVAGVAVYSQRERLSGWAEHLPFLSSSPQPPSGAPAAESASPASPAPLEPVAEQPAPAPVPTPEPDYTAQDLFTAAEGYKESIAAALQRMRPLAKTNDAVDLRLSNGRVKKGILREITADHIRIEANGEVESVPFRKIDPWNRLLCDPVFRSQWIHFRSIAYARNEYTQSGLAVPRADVTGNAPADFTVEIGVPSALLRAGRRHLSDRSENKDLSYAFLYFSCAALQHDMQGQFLFGQMYYYGLGIAKNAGEGLRWISLSAGQGYAPANAFLQKHNVDQQRVARSLEEARQRQEKELKAFAARLDEIRKQELAGAGTTTLAGLRGPRRVSRSLLERYPHYTDSRGRVYIYHPDGRITLVR